jgi:ferredoxin
MISVHVDRTLCQGYGNCVLAEAAVFDIDQEGLAVVDAAAVTEDRAAAIKRAAYDCPTEAITVTDA